MKTIDEEEFLSWAEAMGVVPDARYAPPRCLAFANGSGESRFWTIPRPQDRARQFFSHVLSGLEPWTLCNVWPRGGRWSDEHPPRSRIEAERTLALFGGHVPDGFRGARLYRAPEIELLVNLIVLRSRAAWCVTDDLFVVPDHARQFIHLDHHGVARVKCADSLRMDQFIRHMAAGEYWLPQELPDPTFKRPGWMR